MRFLWIFVCLCTLVGCKTEPADPAAEQVPPEAEAAEPAVDPVAEPTDDTAEPPVEQAPAAEVVGPDAPEDVGMPPKDARRSESGLAWKRLAKGKGKARPKGLDTVVIEYAGWMPNGRLFDSSESHGGPMSVRPSQLIPGVSEALRAMLPGEKRRLWIPAELAYGQPRAGAETGPRQPFGDLVFDVTLLSFEKAPPVPEAPKDVAAAPGDASRSDSGLAWRVVSQGSGTEKPLPTSVVDMVYTVWTADGEVVDSSALRGAPDTVGIKRLVPGWFEGMQDMVEGERRVFWIPEALAYQGAPNRPAGMLVVDVELIQIRRELHQVR